MATKRLIRIVLRLAMVVALFTIPLALTVSAGTAVTVNAPLGLNLRDGPSLVDPIVLVLYHGETVYIVGGPVWYGGISWTHVGVYRWGGYYDGFCASAYLSNYGGYVPNGTSGLMVTAGAGLRLRSGPGLWYGIQRIVPYGAVLQPTGSTQWANGLQWSQIAIDGVYLWAASIYLTAV